MNVMAGSAEGLVTFGGTSTRLMPVKCRLWVAYN